MSISHPWPHATGEYAALGPQYVALGPQDAALSLYSGASGDIMFGPWAAYSPVSLCQGCDIIPMHQWFPKVRMYLCVDLLYEPISDQPDERERA